MTTITEQKNHQITANISFSWKWKSCSSGRERGLFFEEILISFLFLHFIKNSWTKHNFSGLDDESFLCLPFSSDVARCRCYRGWAARRLLLHKLECLSTGKRHHQISLPSSMAHWFWISNFSLVIFTKRQNRAQRSSIHKILILIYVLT